jgi:hypothetical protein
MIQRHYEFDHCMIIIERQFIPRTPLENVKEGKIKDLEDLSCMWCKRSNAYPCFNENMDHIIAEAAEQ